MNRRAIILIGALATPAVAQELPVLDAASGPTAGPAWRGDALLLRLAPAAARLKSA